jgi:hypothetical protein
VLWWGEGGGQLLPDHFYIIDNLLDGDRGREETSDLFLYFTPKYIRVYIYISSSTQYEIDREGNCSEIFFLSQELLLVRIAILALDPQSTFIYRV